MHLPPSHIYLLKPWLWYSLFCFSPHQTNNLIILQGYVLLVSVIDGRRPHSTIPASGVTSTSTRWCQLPWLKYSPGRRWHPYIWRHMLLKWAGNSLTRQLEAHISHTCHLYISGAYLQYTPSRLISSAPTLESLTLVQVEIPMVVVPSDLFNGTTPSLTSLEL